MVFEDFYYFAWLPFGWLLKPTWLHFWRFLGAKLAPSWHQIASKIDLKNHQKIITFYIASRPIFGGFWPPTSTSKGVQRNGFWSSWGGLELSWGQDGPKTSPRGPWDCFWLIFGPILVDFWTEFGRFLDWFWSIVGPMVVDFRTKFHWFLLTYLIDAWTNVVWCFNIF